MHPFTDPQWWDPKHLTGTNAPAGEQQPEPEAEQQPEPEAEQQPEPEAEHVAIDPVPAWRRKKPRTPWRW